VASGLGGALAAQAVAIAAVFGVGLLVALRLRDASVVDPIWGTAFVAAAWASFGVAGGPLWRRALTAALVSAWGGRLSLHLAGRKLRERREDPRYAELLARRGGWRPSSVAVHVFGLQAVLVFVGARPLGAAQAGKGGFSPADGVGGALFFGGALFEAVADRQLAAFKRDPANKGKVMDRGLWRYSRHPNYFGEFLCWWGALALALSAAGAWWAVVSPLLMTALLLRVSGKDLLERHLANRPGYADYVARTSGFLPLPPRTQRR